MPDSNSAKSAVVLSIDGLSAALIGPYGNTTHETPELNRLAAQSCLLENMLADSPNLQLAWSSFLHAVHAGVKQLPAAAVSLPKLLAEAGITSWLLTDDPALADAKLSADFTERRTIAARPKSRCAVDIAKTQFARLMSGAIEWLGHVTQPTLLWIHSQGLYGDWDAPLEFRQQLADEEDPEPPTFVQPPQQILPADFDPDERLGIAQACGGQVMLFDLCLGALLAALDEHPLAAQTLFALVAPRGFPLGEHRRVGLPESCVYGEALHVPCLLRLPDSTGELLRLQPLAQSPDFGATLRDWFGVANAATSDPSSNGHSLLPLIHGEAETLREHAWSLAEGHRAFRTPQWLLLELKPSANPCPDSPNLSQTDVSLEQGKEATNVLDPVTVEPTIELYSKPDDRFEANEVANRCQDEVAALSADLHSAINAAHGFLPT